MVMLNAFAPSFRDVEVRGVPLRIRAPTAREAIELRRIEDAEERILHAIAFCVLHRDGAPVFADAQEVGRADAAVINDLAMMVADHIRGEATDDGRPFEAS